MKFMEKIFENVNELEIIFLKRERERARARAHRFSDNRCNLYHIQTTLCLYAYIEL